jgi:hypothetical protein
MNKPILIFYHTYLVGNFKLLIHEQLLKIFTSGLYDNTDMIHMGITSTDMDNTNWLLNLIKPYSKIKPIVFDENFAEKSTLRYMVDTITNEDCYLYYYMTKNVATNAGSASGNDNQIIKNELWRISMEYNTINRWEECVSYLANGYDAVGCNLRDNTFVGFYPHFSGNFWWASSEHIKTLDHNYLHDTNLLGPQNALLAEFWIGSNHDAKLKSIYECGEIAPYIKESTFNEYIKE